jgi:preprotein translocase subunit SecD
MMSRLARFNLYLLLALLAVWASGCASSPERKKSREQEKQYSTFRLHLESPPDGSVFTASVPIVRANPTMITVTRSPVLDENSVVRAALIETAGGHAIQVQFDDHGRLVLESITSANKGKRMAILCQFPAPRWLAAPRIAQRNTSGVLVFAPDADREESERIVRGLNNTAVKLKNQPKSERKQK